MNKLSTEEAIKHIIKEIKENVDIAIIGMSGGADSTLVTILCKEALGRLNIHSLHMPYSDRDVNFFNDRSLKIANKFGIQRYSVPIYLPVSELKHSLKRHFQDDEDKEISPLNFGNMKSRIRTNMLYSFSSHIGESKPNKRVRVIGTGNLSEDFIGYDTKGGDALSDIFPIGDLFKSEVYKFLEYFVEKGIITEEDIDRVPSAGLEEDQTDEKDLGYTYDEMEPEIRFCLYNYDNMDGINKSKILEFVWDRHVVNKHKHEAVPIIKMRHLLN